MKTNQTPTLSRALGCRAQWMQQVVLLSALLFVNLRSLHADSATWKSSAHNGNWYSRANWLPETVPNGPDDVATFDRSVVTDLYIYNAFVEINEIIFTATAKPYSLNISYGLLEIDGVGVTNNSTVMQNFGCFGDYLSSKAGAIAFGNAANAGLALYTIGGSVNAQDAARLTFTGSSSAGNAHFTVQATTEDDSAGVGGIVGFYEDSTATSASFVLEGDSIVSDLPSQVAFYDSATVGDATFTINGANLSGGKGGAVYAGSLVPEQGNARIIVNGGTASGADGGYMKFQPAIASAGAWHITVNGGTAQGALGGEFECDSFDAGESVYSVNGGIGQGALGGLISFNDTDGVSGTLVANGGRNQGGGGTIQISSSLSGASPAVRVYGNGSFDVTLWTSPSVTSLDGNGHVTLGNQNLSIGNGDVSSSFFGSIFGNSGAITKVGTGTLTLSGPNTYTGQTIVNDGTLLINNTTGSGTGPGPVSVRAGSLGGTGIIFGALTFGIGGGTGAFLAPGASGVGTLTTKSELTLNGDATYDCQINSDTVTADEVAANTVTLSGATQIALTDLGTTMLPFGTTLRMINNTSATAIIGTFSNLPDGSTVAVGNNTYFVSYEGGDGNDLTLTVQ